MCLPTLFLLCDAEAKPGLLLSPAYPASPCTVTGGERGNATFHDLWCHLDGLKTNQGKEGREWKEGVKVVDEKGSCVMKSALLVLFCGLWTLSHFSYALGWLGCEQRWCLLTVKGKGACPIFTLKILVCRTWLAPATTKSTSQFPVDLATIVGFFSTYTSCFDNVQKNPWYCNYFWAQLRPNWKWISFLGSETTSTQMLILTLFLNCIL